MVLFLVYFNVDLTVMFYQKHANPTQHVNHLILFKYLKTLAPSIRIESYQLEIARGEGQLKMIES